MQILHFFSTYPTISYTLVYGLVSLSVTYVLYKKHKFENVDRFQHYALVGMGIVLPFIDLIETCIGIEYELNPFFQHHGVKAFIISYVSRAGASLFLGWVSKHKYRKMYLVLTFWDTIHILVITMNFIAMVFYGVIS